MRGHALTGPALAALAGCAAQGASHMAASGQGAPTYDVDRCEVRPARELIGQSWSLAVEAKAMLLSGASVARVIRPGQPVTSEHFTSRINLILNPADQIVEVRCG